MSASGRTALTPSVSLSFPWQAALHPVGRAIEFILAGWPQMGARLCLDQEGCSEVLTAALSGHVLLAAPGVTPPVRIESSSTSPAEGHTLDLTCIVASPSQARVMWYKRGGSLPPNHQVRRSQWVLGLG